MYFTDIIKKVEENPYSAFFYMPAYYKKSKSCLFLKPKEIISVYTENDLKKTFSLIDKYRSKGLFGYCLINYEAGYLLEKRLTYLLSDEKKILMQFVFFPGKETDDFSSNEIEFANIEQDNYEISNFKLNTSKQKFDSNIKRIKKYIYEGDTYQVNYTVKGKFNFAGSYSGLYKNLLFNQSAKYSAFINSEKNFIISISPELFFRQDKNLITARPMKGTICRSKDTISDNLKSLELENSEKNRAENLMIVDLLRNDLGRICKYGSVKVDEIFRIEKYETLFQMVSKITGKLNKKVNLGEIIKNIFPCGSITGAPKIRTMEIIRELEKEERGIYTGTIGLIGKKSSVFNVAIRTIKIEKATGKGEMGLGSGIVWDSDADNEYIETMLKSEFLTSPLKPFELIETMLVENGEIYLFDKHIERLRNSSKFFMFVFNEEDFAKSFLKLAMKKLSEGKYRLRVTLDKWGKVKYESSILNSLPDEINLIISDEKIHSANVLQYYKTTNRDLYSREYEKYSAEGYFDVIFFNEREELSEGSITNIFVKINNEWLTPMQSCGILPGIYRNLFIQNSNAREERITLDDLLGAEEVTIVNSIRKEIKVNRIQYGNEFVEYSS